MNARDISGGLEAGDIMKKLAAKCGGRHGMYTTLAKIREHSPCSDGWAKLLKHLGKTKADRKPLAIVTILDSNGLDDALWCLRAVSGHAREIRLFAVWCARQAQHLLTDQRSIDAIDVAERFANGKASQQELASAWAAARDTAADAAAGTSAGCAANAALDAARDTAADDAAGASAWCAANAALGAVWVAIPATYAAGAAVHAARGAQEKELRAVCARIAEQEAA
jgi:hypothetical protein